MRPERNTCAGTMEVGTIVPDVDSIYLVPVGCERMVPQRIPERMIEFNLSGFKKGRRVSKDSGRWGAHSVRMRL